MSMHAFRSRWLEVLKVGYFHMLGIYVSLSEMDHRLYFGKY